MGAFAAERGVRQHNHHLQMIAINIDTSRVSMLALGPLDQGQAPLLREVAKGGLYFVLCFTRLRELTRVSADEKRRIVNFLRNVPTVFGQPQTVLEESEIAAGCALATGKPPSPPRPFALESGDWGVGAQASNLTVADILQIATPDLMQDAHLRTLASESDDAARYLGPNSAVVLDRLGPARANIQRFLARRRSTDANFCVNLDAQAVLDGAGGLQAFPTLHVLAELRAARISETQAASKNDMFDEEIARFHPYSAVSILDRKTSARFWRARVPGFERVASDMGKAAAVIAKVRAGELGAHQFSVPRVA